MPFILASASPRRQHLLIDAGYRFTIEPADIDESDYPADLSPGEVANYLARRKAVVVSSRFPEAVVLAADTVVAHGTEMFGKPTDRADARRLLTQLSGSTHSVLTGVVVARGATRFWRGFVVESTVQMRRMTGTELEAYLDTGGWAGKAGAYGIQDPDPFVVKMTGSLSNIVGLPIDETSRALSEAGILPAR